MSTNTIIDTQQVLDIATRLSQLNEQLTTLLNSSTDYITRLTTTAWTGPAAEQTRTSYNSFANKYVQTYHDVLDQYVKFLRTNVSQQFSDVESDNVSLGDNFM